MLNEIMKRRVVLKGIPIWDGRRPSIALRADGFEVAIIQNEFQRLLVDHHAELYAAGHSVGRIEYEPASPPHAPEGTDRAFVGTAFLISPEYALTARHVAQRIATSLNGMTSSGLNQRYFINFGAEWENEHQGRPRISQGARVEIQSVAKANSDWINSSVDDFDFGRLDLAVLKLSAAVWPSEPVALRFGALQANEKIAAIGFPGNPNGNETVNHVRAVFGNTFGYKRASPGLLWEKSNQQRNSDNNNWYIRHDSSVLGGNSGSPIFRIGARGAPLTVIAVHVAGASPDFNIAVSLQGLKDWLAPYLPAD